MGPNYEIEFLNKETKELVDEVAKIIMKFLQDSTQAVAFRKNNAGLSFQNGAGIESLTEAQNLVNALAPEVTAALTQTEQAEVAEQTAQEKSAAMSS